MRIWSQSAFPTFLKYRDVERSPFCCPLWGSATSSERSLTSRFCWAMVYIGHRSTHQARVIDFVQKADVVRDYLGNVHRPVDLVQGGDQMYNIGHLGRNSSYCGP